jgi:hypothetical protein
MRARGWFLGVVAALLFAGAAYGEFSGPSVQPLTCTTHQWINVISASLVPSCAQPSFADISGTATNAQLGAAFSPISAALSSAVIMSSQGTFYDGPSIAQGTGTWWVSGTVTLLDTAGAANFRCKLWDGTTIIASLARYLGAGSNYDGLTLSGYLANPVGNLRVSCEDVSSTSGSIPASGFGTGNTGSTIWAIRIQ